MTLTDKAASFARTETEEGTVGEKQKLKPEMVQVAERALASQLLMEPSTAARLVAAAHKACGEPDGDPCYRFTDLWLQKLRRKGFAEPKRYGRLTYWSYQHPGFDTLARMAAPEPRS